MSSLIKRFLPFGQLAPDSVEIDRPDLEDALNVVPIYQAYRPVEQLTVVSSQADDDEITGGFAHLISTQAPEQKQHPETAGDTLTDDWLDMDRVLAATANEYHVSHVDEEVKDDTDWVRSTTSNGSEISWVLEAPLRTPSAPANPDIVFRFRCRVPGSNFDRNNHRIEYILTDLSGPTSVFGTRTYTIGEVPGTEWEEEEHILSNAEIANISDWEQLQIEFKILSDSGAGGTEVWETVVADVAIGDYKDEDGDTSDIYASLVHTDPSETPNSCRYIQSPEIQAAQSTSYIARLDVRWASAWCELPTKAAWWSA